jgi:integrase
MAVYADKKSGRLTGRWRVELQKGQERYRQRHDSHKAAVNDDVRVKALWATGEASQGTLNAHHVTMHHSISSVTQEASGVLWRGLAGEATSWAHIRIIGEFLGADAPLDKIDTVTIDRLVAELTKRGKSRSTINRYLSHFHTFLTWARRRKLLTTPLADISFDWQKENKGRIRWVTPEEEAQLQQLLPENVWKLVKVGIETGCRRSELIHAEPTQIVGNLLHLWKTKTDAPRTVPMTPATTKLLMDLLVPGAMPTKSKLKTAWDNAATTMGLADDNQFTFHICRHTCATRLVDAGVNLLVIKEWLGHKRIETTQRYAHVKPSNLVTALKQWGDHQEALIVAAQKSAKEPSPAAYPAVGGNRLIKDPRASRN